MSIFTRRRPPWKALTRALTEPVDSTIRATSNCRKCTEPIALVGDTWMEMFTGTDNCAAVIEPYAPHEPETTGETR